MMKASLGTKQPQYFWSDFFFKTGLSSHMHFGIGNQIGVVSLSFLDSRFFAKAFSSLLGLLVFLASFFLAAW